MPWLKGLIMSTLRSLATTCFWLFLIGGTIGAEAQTRAYVASLGGTITVFDTQTNAVIDTITVCPDFTCRPQIPAATPNGARLYVTNFPNKVTVIDTLTNRVIDTITVGESPWGIAFTPDGKRAYVANTGGTISVIDTGTNTVIDTITDTDGPFGVAVTPDGTRAYISNALGTVSVVDTKTNTIITNIPVPDRFGFPARNLVSIVITPDGTHAYVISNSTGQIDDIDTMTNTVFQLIRTDMGSPFAGGNNSIVMSSDGTKVYTAFPFLPTIVLDTFSNTIIATIPTEGFPPFVGLTPDDTKLYVDARMGVSIFDTSTLTMIARVEIDMPIGGVGFATLPEVPHGKDDCKDGGFQRFSALAFRNQGQCIKFVKDRD
jgi:YVTN family beta-propeller protein